MKIGDRVKLSKRAREAIRQQAGRIKGLNRRGTVISTNPARRTAKVRRDGCRYADELPEGFYEVING